MGYFGPKYWTRENYLELVYENIASDVIELPRDSKHFKDLKHSDSKNPEIEYSLLCV